MVPFGAEKKDKKPPGGDANNKMGDGTAKKMNKNEIATIGDSVAGSRVVLPLIKAMEADTFVGH